MLPEKQIMVNYDQLEKVKCPECNCTHFEKILSLAKLPAIMTANGQPQLLELNNYKCIDCDKIFTYNELLKPLKTK